MNIFLTLDYELFFGSRSGTAKQCMLNPTKDLLKILDPWDIKISFFVDSGYLLALEKFKQSYPQLETDYEQVCGQIRNLADSGHGIELHVHPHWEDSSYDGKRWIFNRSRYKLADFSEEQTLEIVSRHCDVLTRISGKNPVAYRAGGWSAQPFEHIGKALYENEILLDSSAFAGGYYQSPHQSFDFRETPRFCSQYLFTSDPAIPVEGGSFTEIPISSIKVSPFFFWRLAFFKTIGNEAHNAYGDGAPVQSPKNALLRMLTIPTVSVVSMDGYKSSMLSRSFAKYERKLSAEDNFVIIGHPKAFTPYSLKKVEEFVKETVMDHSYRTFQQFNSLTQD
ncbi:MAG: hypothetical protein OER83_03325 [Flavobacteriaceae bacterium]|nr:hypothetical protein [Flavobacteriaceae bacterium]MDH3795883.1 hypothetical protein [Flavobacteriaceae bacterium]